MNQWVTLSPRQQLTAMPQASVAFRSDIAASATNSTNASNLGGQPSAFYRDASNMNAGTLASARLSGAYSGALSFTNSANTLDRKSVV